MTTTHSTTGHPRPPLVCDPPSESDEDAAPVSPKRKNPVSNSDSGSSSFHSLSGDSSDDDSLEVQHEDEFTLKATRQKERVTAYRDIGDGFRIDEAMDTVLSQRVEVVFCALKGLIGAQGKNVQIDLDHQIIWIREADGTGAVSQNLATLIQGNDDVRQCAENLIALAKIIWPKAPTPPAIAPGCKAPGNTTVVAPSAIARKTQNDYSTCAKAAMQLYCARVFDPAKQDAALRRITAVESIISQMQKAIDRELNTHRQNLAAATTAQDTQTAQAAVYALNKHSKINRLGLYVAAAFSDSVDPRDPEKALKRTEQIAAEIQRALQSHLDIIHTEMVNEGVHTLMPEWFPEGIRGTPNPFIAKDEAYAKWAAALAFSVLPEELARKGAGHYWAKEKSQAYKDTVEDELIRFVVRREGEPASTQIISTPLLDDMFAVVKIYDHGFGPTLQSLKDGVQPILANTNPLTATEREAKIAEMNARHQF